MDYLADVWLNGIHLGSHEGGETPFIFDVTDRMFSGKNNKLTVRVLNPTDERIDGIILGETPHRNKVVGFRNGSLPDYGGIIESVELLFTPAVHIKDIFVRSDWKTGHAAVSVILQSELRTACKVRLHYEVAVPFISQTLLHDEVEFAITPGQNTLVREIQIDNHRLWDIDAPHVYHLTVSARCSNAEGIHYASASFGFRDFRVVNGYFRLNDQRLFVRSTHTGNHCPYRAIAPPEAIPDLLRKDLLYAKASGFNMVRFDFGVAHPYQLDLCDELGLMVYEESSAGWMLKDSPQMKERYENSMREMVLRDRNHPSIVQWGMLNETVDGPVYLEGASALPFMRRFDDTRLILLSSGRFDGHLEVGSVSNPGTLEWERVWGDEAPAAPRTSVEFPSGTGSGDFHLYPKVPQTAEIDRFIRKLGESSKQVFLSEYGIGSMMNVIHEARMYEQVGIPDEAEDYIFVRSMAERFSADWSRFGMDSVYPFPETMLQRSQASMARHRLRGFNALRANPKLCGYNLTGMLDHAFTGEGVWRFWRDWKPGAFDAMQDGWAPVRWCLFVEPTHSYKGRPVMIEAVLATEGQLPPGDYPARFVVSGPEGVVWEHRQSIKIPHSTSEEESPFAVPVIKEKLLLGGPAGDYEFVPCAERGIAPPETSWQFHLTDPASLPRTDQQVATWGIPQNVVEWLKAHGVSTVPFHNKGSDRREVIIIGDVSPNSSADFFPWQLIERPSQWITLAERMAAGSIAIFLTPQALQSGKESTARLPLAKKGRVYEFWDWLYHKECVAKQHPVFEGLQAAGLLDWYYYGPMLPAYLFDGQETPSEVIAAAFATGYSTPGGYASGVLLGSYPFGAGQFFINTFPILEHIDQHPVADRLLLNLIRYAAEFAKTPPVDLPQDFQSQLRKIGFTD